mmetsp:Transcript_84633/g.218117  ORF Transcript_84633/g.218117 Transcript_84633/m.218117 type:complete len:236 (-) Transcript_84633:1726-2433(-)
MVLFSMSSRGMVMASNERPLWSIEGGAEDRRMTQSSWTPVDDTECVSTCAGEGAEGACSTGAGGQAASSVKSCTSAAACATVVSTLPSSDCSLPSTTSLRPLCRCCSVSMDCECAFTSSATRARPRSMSFMRSFMSRLIMTCSPASPLAPRAPPANASLSRASATEERLLCRSASTLCRRWLTLCAFALTSSWSFAPRFSTSPRSAARHSRTPSPPARRPPTCVARTSTSIRSEV